ncbi:hypothetical protein [Pseudomonas putida]|uniref:hypothetical protein n=1 Tax=Pseudomonas putida TaxID=303 RepID=UPI001146F264|nr:hypothetical protein [Pseudomonas putida]
MRLSKLENYNASGEQVVCAGFVYFSCAESRSTYILESGKISSQKVISLSSIDSGGEGLSELSDLLQSVGQDELIVVDISCIPRAIMAEILYRISISKKIEINIIFLYAVAGFTEPKKLTTANEAIEPVHQRFSGWSTPETKPTSLVLGLGYEPHKAAGASEYFEPSDQWVFVPSSPVKEFGVKVKENNSSILTDTRRDRLIEYDVTDPEMTFGQLEMVISILLRQSNPILLPFGPKIFFFLCLVHCFGHPELGVWGFSTKTEAISPEVSASDVLVGVLCQFAME